MIETILSIIILVILCPVLILVGVAGISGAPNLTPAARYLPAAIIYAGTTCGIAAVILLVKLIICLF